MTELEFFASEEYGYVGNIFYDMSDRTDFGQLCCLLFYGDYYENISVHEQLNIIGYGRFLELKYDRLLKIDDERVDKVYMRDKRKSAIREYVIKY
jgi:hypothetical protein